MLLPTYNERENLPVIAELLLAYADLRVLVIDDGSPDGTGAARRRHRRRQRRPRSPCCTAAGKRGLGRSYLDGMRAALATDAELIFQMDADLSHDPQYVPDLVAATRAADIVIGSRYLQGVSVVNWPLRRLILSTFANWYVRTDHRHGRPRLHRRLPLLAPRGDRRRCRSIGIVSDGYSFHGRDVVPGARRPAARSARCRSSSSSGASAARRSRRNVIRESLFTPWRMACCAGCSARAAAGRRATILRPRDHASADAAAPSLSIFFPAYNDSGTIASLVIRRAPRRRHAHRRLRGDRRQRRQQGRHRRDPRRADARLPRALPGRAPRGQPRLRRRAAYRVSPPPPRTWSSTPTATPSTTRAR